MLKKIAFFSIMVEKTCFSAYFCSMTYKKTNRRDDDKRRDRGAEGGRDSAKGKSYRGAEGAESRERGTGSRERKPYGTRSDERGAGSRERKQYSSDRPARNDERGAGSRERKQYGSERPERKSYSSEKPKRKSSTSRTPAAKPGPFDKFNIDKMREAKQESLEKKERGGRRGAGSRERGAGSREYGAGSREYGAGSRERGAGREERAERTDRTDRTERGPRTERATRTERTNRTERTERAPRTERPVRAERTTRPERTERSDRAEAPAENTRSKGFERKKTDPDAEIRLNRYIANSGVCSRRKADELIEKGEVSVNGEIVRELGYKVKYSDKIKFQGKLLKPGNLVYVLLNKPKDFITTMDDPMERRTVIDLTAKITNERIFPVGRLDRNTTGLLLLTNDGDLADKLSHPRNQVRKVYEVELDKSLIAKDFEKVREGVELEDGPAKVDQISYLDGKSKKFVGVEIHIGRNRIVRRIFESLGYEVVRLDRVIYAGLTKKDLPRGRCRLLTKEELIYLKHLNKY
jgi:23S rRNA pseudouridine2605 synthase